MMRLFAKIMHGHESGAAGQFPSPVGDVSLEPRGLPKAATNADGGAPERPAVISPVSRPFPAGYSSLNCDEYWRTTSQITSW